MNINKTPLIAKRRNSFEQITYFKNMPEEKAEKLSYEELFTQNWKSGITVALVNIPLSIALAVASGSTPSAGIISAIVGGIVSGLIGGSHFNIVGPTGALSGFLASCVVRYGPACLPYIAITSGLIALIVKHYNLARYIDLFPTAVNEGFTLGVACIIILNQLGSALGIGKIKGEEGQIALIHEEESLIHKTMNILKHADQTNPQDFIVFIIFFVALFNLIKKMPKIPWHMVAALVGITLSALNIIKVQTLRSKFGDFSFQIINLQYLKDLNPSFFFDPRLWVDTLPIAFISVLESLISAKIADEITHTHFRKNMEVKSLAVSNLISGLLGGIPVTAALARTTLNIKTGATRKFSSLLNGIFLLTISVLLLSLFRHLPLCVAAAQVCMVAVRMVNTTEIEIMYEKDKNNFYLLIIIALICVVNDPTVGLIFGILIYLIIFADSITYPWSEIISTPKRNFIDAPNHNENNENSLMTKEHNKYIDSYNSQVFNLFLSDLPSEEGNYILYRIIGIINFMNIKEHTEKLKTLAGEDNSTVVISFRYLHYIDMDAMHNIKHLLHEVSLERKRQSIEKSFNHKIIITGLNKYNIQSVTDKDWIEELKKDKIIIYKD